jgi:putative ABC transport system permease protein
MASCLKQPVKALNADLPVFGIRAMSELVSDTAGQPRFRTLLLMVFAGIAVIPAGAGIYGVLCYAVSLRKHELGIRVALRPARNE